MCAYEWKWKPALLEFSKVRKKLKIQEVRFGFGKAWAWPARNRFSAARLRESKRERCSKWAGPLGLS